MSIPSENKRLRLEPREYTVGWISALPIEYAAAVAMLDEQHEPPDRLEYDETLYTLGRVHGHNVVVACLPAGIIGIASAANIATFLMSRFLNAKIGLMVGLGGGVPSNGQDIRLGDVVVSQPVYSHGGVVQYDMGKRLPNGKFEKTGHLDKPPRPLLNALAEVQKNHILGESSFFDHLAKLEAKSKFSRQKAGPDRLFRPDYQHTVEGPDCTLCDVQKLVKRPDRSEDELVQFHYGIIASSNSLIKDGIERDRVCQDLDNNVLCFEMEAAGLINNFPCLVIRGICDYADSHKNKKWQPYAAATAAAYAKEILSVITQKEVADLAPIKAPWVLPFNRNPQFTGRSDILERLYLCLQNPEHHPYAAVYGLGGSGKSAVAIELAYRTKERNPMCAVFWVSSFTVQRFEESYREIARQLQIPGADDMEQDMLSPVRRKLSGEDISRWLMIVDNADDKGVLFHIGTNGRRLYDDLPRSRHGIILFTTRDRKIAVDLAQGENYALGEMKTTEAKDLLHKALQNDQTLYSETAVDKFLEMLTYLPLAIIQAVTFMKANGTSLQRYVDLFQETHQSMMTLLHEDFNDPNRDIQSLNAVVLTWQISFERIKQENRHAAEYLDFLACISPQNIPRGIFPSLASGIEQDKALGTLTAHAFLNKRTKEGYYDVHILVHHVNQSRIRGTDRWLGTAQKVIKRLMELIPPGGHDQAMEYSLYLLHGRFTADITEIVDEEDTIKLLDNIGRCYFSLGEYGYAASTHQEVLKRRERTIGLVNKATLISMNQLGLALDSHGAYFKAEKTLRETFELKKEVFGTEHPSTLTSQANLALTYRHQGRWNEAESLLMPVLEMRNRVLGGEHPDTLTSQGNLASTYWHQGRWSEAESLEVQVVETSLRVLGPEHPDTLTSQGNLALTYQHQGRWSEAESLLMQVIETSLRVHGAEHPDTLTSQGNLALTYWNQGRWNEAESLEVQVVETSLRVLGGEHPNTLTRQGNLASTYQHQGRWSEAESLEVQVMETSLRVLGAEHPDTLTSQGNLASTYQHQGRWSEAESLEVQVMETSLQVLGPEHPSTLTSQGNLALTYQHQGRLSEAESLLTQVMETSLRVLGAEHPSTLASQGNLASTYRSQGRWNEAESLKVQVMETSLRVLGGEHPNTINSMDSLAYTFKDQDRIEEAIQLMDQCAKLSTKCLGAEHYLTARRLSDVTSWQESVVAISGKPPAQGT